MENPFPLSNLPPGVTDDDCCPEEDDDSREKRERAELIEAVEERLKNASSAYDKMGSLYTIKWTDFWCDVQDVDTDELRERLLND